MTNISKTVYFRGNIINILKFDCTERKRKAPIVYSNKLPFMFLIVLYPTSRAHTLTYNINKNSIVFRSERAANFVKSSFFFFFFTDNC